MPVAKRRPSPQRPIPSETMAAVLSASSVDLGSASACICELRASQFSDEDICDGLELAMERARELRAATLFSVRGVA